jgi:hypothetical protein
MNSSVATAQTVSNLSSQSSVKLVTLPHFNPSYCLQPCSERRTEKAAALTGFTKLYLRTRLQSLAIHSGFVVFFVSSSLHKQQIPEKENLESTLASANTKSVDHFIRRCQPATPLSKPHPGMPAKRRCRNRLRHSLTPKLRCPVNQPGTVCSHPVCTTFRYRLKNQGDNIKMSKLFSQSGQRLF